MRSKTMSDMQDPLERAYYSMLDAATAMGKAEQAYEQALAEETWEYSYQELRGDEWETAFNDVTHLEEWWDNQKEAEWAAVEYMKRGHPCRIVRRRVSPMEVING